MGSHVRNIGFAVQAFQLVLCGVLLGLCFYDSAYIPGGITIGAFLFFLAGVIGTALYVQWVLIIYGIFSVLWFLFCLFLALLNQNVIPVSLPQATFGENATQVIADNIGADLPVTIIVLVIYALNGFLALVGAFMSFFLFKQVRVEGRFEDYDQDKYGGFA